MIPAKRLETSQAYAGDGVIPAKRLETSQAYAGDGVIPAKRIPGDISGICRRWGDSC